ncbi:MAG: hypothetical protein RL532_714, partial [Actinomycetota bacterium]
MSDDRRDDTQPERRDETQSDDTTGRIPDSSLDFGDEFGVVKFADADDSQPAMSVDSTDTGDECRLDRYGEAAALERSADGRVASFHRRTASHTTDDSAPSAATRPFGSCAHRRRPDRPAQPTTVRYPSDDATGDESDPARPHQPDGSRSHWWRASCQRRCQWC